MIHIKSGKVGMGVCGTRFIYKENGTQRPQECTCRKCLLIVGEKIKLKVESARNKKKPVSNKYSKVKISEFGNLSDSDKIGYLEFTNEKLRTEISRLRNKINNLM